MSQRFGGWRMKWALCLLLAALVFSIATVPVNAADYSITVDRDSVRVRLALNFQQNLTALDPSFTLPVVNGVFSPANSTIPASLVTSAIQYLLPGARIEDFAMTFVITPWSNLTSTQSISLTVSFRLIGASRQDGSLFLVDTSWKSFNVSDDILARGVSLNRIGLRYFADTAQRLVASRSPSAPGGLEAKWEGSTIPSIYVQQVVSRIRSLDFTRAFAGKPISQWNKSFDPRDVSTIFTLDRTRTVFSLTVVIPEAVGEEARLPYALTNQLLVEVKAQGLATADGNLLTLDPATGYQPLLMAAVIASVVTLLVFSSFWERKLTRRAFQRSYKRSKKGG